MIHKNNSLKKIEYFQVEYGRFPSASTLNEEGLNGWELIEIHQEDKRFFDCDEQLYNTQKIYLATFKREYSDDQFRTEQTIEQIKFASF